MAYDNSALNQNQQGGMNVLGTDPKEKKPQDSLVPGQQQPGQDNIVNISGGQQATITADKGPIRPASTSATSSGQFKNINKFLESNKSGIGGMVDTITKKTAQQVDPIAKVIEKQKTDYLDNVKRVQSSIKDAAEKRLSLLNPSEIYSSIQDKINFNQLYSGAPLAKPTQTHLVSDNTDPNVRKISLGGLQLPDQNITPYLSGTINRNILNASLGKNYNAEELLALRLKGLQEMETPKLKSSDIGEVFTKNTQLDVDNTTNKLLKYISNEGDRTNLLNDVFKQNNNPYSQGMSKLDNLLIQTNAPANLKLKTEIEKQSADLKNKYDSSKKLSETELQKLKNIETSVNESIQNSIKDVYKNALLKAESESNIDAAKSSLERLTQIENEERNAQGNLPTFDRVLLENMKERMLRPGAWSDGEYKTDSFWKFAEQMNQAKTTEELLRMLEGTRKEYDRLVGSDSDPGSRWMYGTHERRMERLKQYVLNQTPLDNFKKNSFDENKLDSSLAIFDLEKLNKTIQDNISKYDSLKKADENVFNKEMSEGYDKKKYNIDQLNELINSYIQNNTLSDKRTKTNIKPANLYKRNALKGLLK